MIYIYALTDLQALPSIPHKGIGGQPLFLHPNDGLAAICSEHDDVAMKPDGTNIVTHERVIETCMATGAVLPARFGMCFDNLDQLDAILELNHQALRAGLDRVRGCVEMGVRVLFPALKHSDSPAAELQPASSGKAYLQQRAKAERARLDARSTADRATEELHGQFSLDTIDGTLRRIAASPLQLSGAYLVRRDQIERFQQRVRDIAALHHDLRILGTGPWPPYHFAPKLNLRSPAEVCHA